MIKGTIDSYELWQSRPENLNENMEDEIKAAENRGWNQCNRSWIKTIEGQPRVGEWIPCSEMLPEDDVIVLVSGRALDYPCILAKGKDLSYWYEQNVKNLAWMPLPPAFKGE